MRLDCPALSLPRAGRSETTIRRLIEGGLAGLRAGAVFVFTSGEPPAHSKAVDDNVVTRVGRAFEKELRIGFRVLIIATLLAGCWLVLMPLAAAVVVPGNLVVEFNVKAIQHPTGGIVAEIKVKNGDRVNAGDLLVRLDATQTKANLQMVSKQLDELRARIGRLTAERDGLDRPNIPPELAQRSKETSVGSFLASENSLFKARSSGRASQRACCKIGSSN